MGLELVEPALLKAVMMSWYSLPNSSSSTVTETLLALVFSVKFTKGVDSTSSSITSKKQKMYSCTPNCGQGDGACMWTQARRFGSVLWVQTFNQAKTMKMFCFIVSQNHWVRWLYCCHFKSYACPFFMLQCASMSIHYLSSGRYNCTYRIAPQHMNCRTWHW